MKYIILDLEWNIPLTKNKRITEPINLLGEIIQIGAVKLNEDFQYESNFKINIQPEYYTVMHKKVEEITKISDEDLEYGILFEDAYRNFAKWCGDDVIFLTWGCNDIPMLRDNLILHNKDTEWISRFYNLQVIYNHQISLMNRQFSLSDAVESVHEKVRNMHDALNDAMSTYDICKHLNLSEGIQKYDEYIKNNKLLDTENSKTYEVDMPQKFYSTKFEFFEDEEVIGFDCPECNSKLCCLELVEQNGDKKISIIRCECGAEYFVRFKLIKSGDGFRIRRNIYELNEEYLKFYTAKKDKNRYKSNYKN